MSILPNYNEPFQQTTSLHRLVIPQTGSPDTSEQAMIGVMEKIDLELVTVAVYPRIGGMTAWLEQIACGLSQLGWRVRLVAISPDADDVYSDKPYQYRHLPMPDPRGGAICLVDQLSRWKNAWNAYYQLMAGQPQPRLRMADSTPGVLRMVRRLSSRDKTPWVVTAGGDIFAETSQSFLAGVRHTCIRSDLKQASLVMVDGEDLKKSLSQKGVPKENIGVFYHGVDVALFEPSTPAVQNYFPADSSSTKVLWHGKHQTYNGPLRFVDIAEKIGPARVRMIGDGPLRPKLEQRLAAVGNASWYLGPLPQNQVPKFLVEGQVGVYPLVDMAGVPRVLLESLAAGNATVCWPTGAVDQVIQHDRNGLVCRGEQDTVQTVKALLANPEKIKALGQSGQATVRANWSEQAMLDKLSQRLERLMS